MREKKYHILLDDFERRVIVRCLNEIRSQLILTGKPVDGVNEIIFKIIGAKQKRIKVAYKEAGL